MFQAVDAALIRAAAYPQDLTLPAWPDLTTDQPEQWLKWLREAWALPEFAAAVGQAAPDLATQITRADAGEPIQTRQLRRLVEATVRYLLRWTTRATPFGRLAGVAPIEFGPRATVRWGERHHEVTRPDDRCIAEATAAAERDLETLRTVTVMTNSLGYRQAGVWVLPCARAEDHRIWDVEIDLTGPPAHPRELRATRGWLRRRDADLATTMVSLWRGLGAGARPVSAPAGGMPRSAVRGW